jgi:hypothetical protein
MSDTAGPGTDGQEAFDDVDPKLNMFALANGMDLAKGEGYRRLEWFTEGLERGILIAADPAGTYSVRVLCWKTGKTEELSDADVGEGLSSDETIKILTDAIETANTLTP